MMMMTMMTMTVTNRKVVKVLGSRGTCRGMVYAVCVGGSDRE